ncbi:MAG: folylpolyglutamate synthase/dihydrofolate synthase family protein [Ferruginibacter sp.]
MTYDQTIEYLYEHLPMFSRIGAAAYKKDLHNTIELCRALGDPQQEFKSIHIAGTNGKGSTSHMLAAVLQEAGYKTGLYTSPHIKDFGERIRINGKMIDRDFVIDFVERTRIISDEVNPSFFELTVAMAFEYFAKESVDIAVIETGLGGRLDSTNIITPLLSVITNIGYDHMNILGNTLPEIAFEKAGIIKNNIPVVIGETLPETKPVFVKKAKEMNAEIHFTEERFITRSTEPAGSLLRCNVVDTSGNEMTIYKIDLLGLYQAKNICTVLHAVSLLNKMGFNIPETTVHSGLGNVKKLTGLRGRWELLDPKPALILDVAHNEDGIKQVLHQLKTNYPLSHIHFVLGFVNDKDVSKMLALFPADASYYFTNAHIPRALPYEQLKQVAELNHLHGEGFDHVNAAIEKAKLNMKEQDVIMVCGSFFIIAEVYK